MFFLLSRAGKHEYKFYVDGKWVHDPTATAIANDHGSKNNVVEVRPSDYDAFTALSEDSGKPEKKMSTAVDPASMPANSAFSTDVYGQEVTQRRAYEQVGGPPLLPPHLKDVILNQSVPQDCEPNLLPQPTHVELNHMYALSIKDGVMVSLDGKQLLLARKKLCVS